MLAPGRRPLCQSQRVKIQRRRHLSPLRRRHPSLLLPPTTRKQTLTESCASVCRRSTPPAASRRRAGCEGGTRRQLGAGGRARTSCCVCFSVHEEGLSVNCAFVWTQTGGEEGGRPRAGGGKQKRERVCRPTDLHEETPLRRTSLPSLFLSRFFVVQQNRVCFFSLHTKINRRGERTLTSRFHLTAAHTPRRSPPPPPAAAHPHSTPASLSAPQPPSQQQHHPWPGRRGRRRNVNTEAPPL